MLTTPPTENDSKHSKLIIDFSAESFCPPCRVIAPIFKNIEKEYTNINFYKIEVGEHSEFSQEHDIRTVPTFVSFHNGVEVSRFSGANESKLRQMLNELNDL